MELECALEIIFSLKNSLLFTDEKTKAQENGVTLISPSVCSISRVRNLPQKAHISTLFFYLFIHWANAFYELSGMRVNLRLLAKRGLAGQICNLTKMTRAFVLLAIEGRSIYSVPSLWTHIINHFHTFFLIESSWQPFEAAILIVISPIVLSWGGWGSEWLSDLPQGLRHGRDLAPYPSISCLP